MPFLLKYNNNNNNNVLVAKLSAAIDFSERWLLVGVPEKNMH